MPKLKQPPTACEVFARNLRRVRRLKELTQEELALKAEMARAYVSLVEQGTTNISLGKAEALAKAVGVPLKDLLDPDMFPGLEDN